MSFMACFDTWYRNGIGLFTSQHLIIPKSRSSCRMGYSINQRLSMRGHYTLSITAGTIGLESCPSMNLPFRSQRRAKCRIKITKNKNKFALYPFSALIVSSSGFIVILSSFRFDPGFQSRLEMYVHSRDEARERRNGTKIKSRTLSESLKHS